MKNIYELYLNNKMLSLLVYWVMKETSIAKKIHYPRQRVMEFFSAIQFPSSPNKPTRKASYCLYLYFRAFSKHINQIYVQKYHNVDHSVTFNGTANSTFDLGIAPYMVMTLRTGYTTKPVSTSLQQTCIYWMIKGNIGEKIQ